MWEWVVIAVLWALNVLLLRWLGGVGAAGEAIERWGRAAAERRRRRAISPSA